MASSENVGRSPFYGSQPPAYDAAITSVQPNCQQPVMMVQAPPIPTPPVQGMQHPSYNGPADFFVLILITTIVCGFLNLTSLIFGTIALVMAVTAWNKKTAYDYPSAQRYSVVAVVLSFCNIIWTWIWATIIIGGVVGGYYRRYYYYY